MLSYVMEVNIRKEFTCVSMIKLQLLVMIRLTINHLCQQICVPNSTTVLYQLVACKQQMK